MKIPHSYSTAKRSVCNPGSGKQEVDVGTFFLDELGVLALSGPVAPSMAQVPALVLDASLFCPASALGQMQSFDSDGVRATGPTIYSLRAVTAPGLSKQAASSLVRWLKSTALMEIVSLEGYLDWVRASRLHLPADTYPPNEDLLQVRFGQSDSGPGEEEKAHFPCERLLKVQVPTH